MRLRARLCAFVFAMGFYALGVCQPSSQVTAGNEAPSGMVWEKHGEWHLNGSAAELRLGEAIPPGGLVTAGTQSAPHSMTILLPDGQRLLCECYQQKACSQGFRIPAITPSPSAAVWSMFVEVRNVLLLRPASAETAVPILTGRAGMAGKVEMVAAINSAGEVSIAPALRVLPSGEYSLNIVRDGSQADASVRPATQSLIWTIGQKSAAVRVGEPGLYRIRVLDRTYVPRMEIEVLSASASSAATEAAGLKVVRETILGWNQTHGGWSLHDFLRVYLQARELTVLAANSQ